MAKLSSINKNNKRIKLSNKFFKKRQALKKIIMNKKKKLFCFIDTIESWDYLKKEYKDFNKIICTASPELLLDNNIKEKKIIIDGKKISIIKPLANDLGDVCEKIVKKIKSKGISHNFAIQYVAFIFQFTNLPNLTKISKRNKIKIDIFYV